MQAKNIQPAAALAHAAIKKRMASGEPFMVRQLDHLPEVRAYDDARPVDCFGEKSGQESFRMADHLVQKWRKKGWITLTRKGLANIWSLTDVAREAFAGGDQPGGAQA